MWLTWPGNYFNDEMSADAAGMIATLCALNDFAEQISPAFGEKHRRLYDGISHILKPEAHVYAAWTNAKVSAGSHRQRTKKIHEMNIKEIH